ncbi:MAG TPA: hypothetical protein VKU39_00630, partial [Streptosporangiaceae bacterium]|nr:hypothetical protein [Streptosporangiaceae bacterium]
GGGNGTGGGTVTADPVANAINRQPVGTIPAGYRIDQRTGTDAGTTAGFSIGYPSSGWSKSDNGVNSVLRLSAATYTRIDLTTHTYPNDMLAEARYIRDASMVNHPGYHEIALGRMTIRGASGAYWEFIWDDNGVKEQWLDLVWVANTPAGSQSYALLFAAPQSAWTQMSSTFAAQAQSFQTNPS